MCEAAVVSLHSHQPGDPKAASLRIVDAVKGEGAGAGEGDTVCFASGPGCD